MSSERQEAFFAAQEDKRINDAFPIAHCLYGIMQEAEDQYPGAGHVADVISLFFGQVRQMHPGRWPEDFNPLEAMELLEVLGLTSRS